MALHVEHLSARYGRIEVCRDVSFTAADGEFLVVLGPNGAGKSTLLGALAGTVAGGGDIGIAGRMLQRTSARQRARMGLALVPEGRRNLFSPLTVEENLQLGLRLLPAAERAAMQASLHSMFPILSERARQTAGLLSGGEQQMLAIAVAIARRPSVLLLDEPSQGLAPVILDRLVEVISALRAIGLIVVLAEQNHRFAARLADRYVVLQGGDIVGSGPGAELADQERAADALLSRPPLH
ncbi:ATP-binding cassette domain-containing protein [Bradyrhizobium lablabi]|uniref:ABC transporter ATP-binding protein n=1 Tax=Bradyrhizobium lablabi TaxID=722472 RepID=UPI001BA562F2|nr:ATP-binding cassette domain-containing protein [Bradyrhizobium lablabi]MBR1125689.1 ATP-binding cassette domain-containing protein [Bradyrhizobium lablabi]